MARSHKMPLRSLKAFTYVVGRGIPLFERFGSLMRKYAVLLGKTPGMPCRIQGLR